MVDVTYLGLFVVPFSLTRVQSHLWEINDGCCLFVYVNAINPKSIGSHTTTKSWNKTTGFENGGLSVHFDTAASVLVIFERRPFWNRLLAVIVPRGIPKWRVNIRCIYLSKDMICLLYLQIYLLFRRTTWSRPCSHRSPRESEMTGKD